MLEAWRNFSHLLDTAGGGLPSAKEAENCDDHDKEYRTNGRADTNVENHSRTKSVIGWHNQHTITERMLTRRRQFIYKNAI